MPVREPTCSTFSRLGRLPLRLLPQPLLLPTLLLFLPCLSLTLADSRSGTHAYRTGDHLPPPHTPQTLARASLQTIEQLSHTGPMTPTEQGLKIGAAPDMEDHTRIVEMITEIRNHHRHPAAHLEVGDRKESTMGQVSHPRLKQGVSTRQSTGSNIEGHGAESSPFKYNRATKDIGSYIRISSGRLGISVRGGRRGHAQQALSRLHLTEGKRETLENNPLQKQGLSVGPSSDPGAVLSASPTHALHQLHLKSSRQLLLTGADADKVAGAESLPTGRINHHLDSPGKSNNGILTQKPIHSLRYDSTVNTLPAGLRENPFAKAGGRKLLSTESQSTLLVEPLPASSEEAIAEDDPAEGWNDTLAVTEPQTFGRRLRDLMTDLGREFHRGRGSHTTPLIRLLRGPWLLALNTSGSVYVTKDVNDVNTVFLSRNVDNSLVTLQGRQARKFLTFSKKGHLTATRRMNRRAHFISLRSMDHSLSYLSKSGQRKFWYIGVTDNGDLTTYTERHSKKKRHRKPSTAKPVLTSQAISTATATGMSEATSAETSVAMSTGSEGLTKGTSTVRTNRRKHHKKTSQRRRGRRKCRTQKCTCLRNRHLAPWCQFRMVPLDGDSHRPRS